METDHMTLAFSSKTTYKINQKSGDFVVNTMRVQGKDFSEPFKLSKIFDQLIKKMQDQNLKQNIVHNIHILGCMEIREIIPSHI